MWIKTEQRGEEALNPLGTMTVHGLLERVAVEFRHHKHLLRCCSAAGDELVPPDRNGDPQLECWTAALHATDHCRSDGLDGRFASKGLQPGNQSLNIRAVGDYNPAQIGTNSLILIEVSGYGYVMESASPR